jgi:hypothetical protein
VIKHLSPAKNCELESIYFQLQTISFCTLCLVSTILVSLFVNKAIFKNNKTMYNYIYIHTYIYCIQNVMKISLSMNQLLVNLYHLMNDMIPWHFVCVQINCHSPTQPQLELEFDLIMGRKPPTHHPTPHRNF